MNELRNAHPSPEVGSAGEAERNWNPSWTLSAWSPSTSASPRFLSLAAPPPMSLTCCHVRLRDCWPMKTPPMKQARRPPLEAPTSTGRFGLGYNRFTWGRASKVWSSGNEFRTKAVLGLGGSTSMDERARHSATSMDDVGEGSPDGSVSTTTVGDRFSFFGRGWALG